MASSWKQCGSRAQFVLVSVPIDKLNYRLLAANRIEAHRSSSVRSLGRGGSKPKPYKDLADLFRKPPAFGIGARPNQIALELR
jgi:hypothetical protein